jgi:hypothetical protein
MSIFLRDFSSLIGFGKRKVWTLPEIRLYITGSGEEHFPSEIRG